MIRIDFPDTILLATGQTEEEFVAEAKLIIAAKLFELGRISSGRAAEISGMNRGDFLLAAGRSGVPLADLDGEELDREFLDA